MIVGVEGLPGAGKTSIVEQLPYTYMREMLVTPEEEASFTDVDYIEHDERKVRLATLMAKRSFCLIDRTELSYYAYAYAQGTLPPEALPISTSPAIDHFIYLDISPELSTKRRVQRAWTPSLAFTQKVAVFYEYQFSSMTDRVTKIDAGRPLEDVQTDVVEVIEQLRVQK